MQVELTKRADGGSCATFVRDDGVRLRLWSYDRTGEVPHDAVHLVGEQCLGLRDGLWGSLAAGALFDSVEVLDGRRRHDDRRRSDEVRRRNAEQLRLAETVVGVLQESVDRDAAAVKARLDRAWGITRVGPGPFTVDQAAAAVAQLRELRAQWRSLSGEQVVSLTWRTGSGRSSSRRTRRRSGG